MLERAVERDDQPGRAIGGDLRAQDGREGPAGRAHLPDPAQDHGHAASRHVHVRPLGVVIERGCDAALRVGQCDPELHAVQCAGGIGRRLLGMRDTAARRHQVQRAGDGESLRPEAVPMQGIAREEPRDRLQADVRMRRHVHGLPSGLLDGPEHVEEAPGADEAARAARKETADGDGADVGDDGRDFLDHVRGRLAVADFRALRGPEVAHRDSFRVKASATPTRVSAAP